LAALSLDLNRKELTNRNS